ncbi:hypothetical protein Tco_0688709 [Tanacetum coccineum]
MADKGNKSSMETFCPNDKADYYSGITSITDYWKIGGDEIEVSDDESFDLEEYWSDKEETVKNFKIETVRIKSFLMLFGITTVLIDVNAAQSKLVLLENFNENYSKCLRLLVKLQLSVQSYYC